MRDNDEMLGEVATLKLTGWSIYLTYSDASLISDNVSLQYKICNSDYDSGWTSLNWTSMMGPYNSVKMMFAGANLDIELTDGLEPDDYTLEIFYDVADATGEHHYFLRDSNVTKFTFTVPDTEPDILGLSMTITDSYGENIDIWYERGDSHEPYDMRGKPIQSFVINDFFVFTEGVINSVGLSIDVRDMATMDYPYGDYLQTELTEYAWAYETPYEIIQNLPDGDYMFRFAVYAMTGKDELIKLDNGEDDPFIIMFTVGSGTDIPGDLNGDGNVNTGDISELYKAILNGYTDAKYDLNNDGSINTGDVSALYTIILSGQ